MSIGAAIAIAAIWFSTGGTLCYFREEVSAFAVILAFGIAAGATLAIAGVH